ncbi:DUF1289 domain-containing protein [Thioclava sp. GXIMD4216]|uniref:DUF1289 domain-containing protein n=1 Tax=Thioclava litoralis TaxID=3076557 RepID=A0ABZ1DZ27_9RHOB|nr:DUF1289 domain-containing protein [Thioclava sp. FTW29]
MARIKSPCRNICTFDPASQTCLDCLRSLDEIARWGTMSHMERQKILKDLPRRRKAAPPTPDAAKA